MVYKWYFSCQLGDGLCHRSHLLGEPETTIDESPDFSWFTVTSGLAGTWKGAMNGANGVSKIPS